MAYIKRDKLWETELDNFVLRKVNVQDLTINQLNFAVHDAFQKNEKQTTNFKAVNDKNAKNKAFPDEKLVKKKMVNNRFQMKVTRSLNYTTTNNL